MCRALASATRPRKRRDFGDPMASSRGSTRASSRLTKTEATALYAILDIRSDILSRPGAPSDAAMLAQLTGIPTLFWGFLWSAIALGTCAWLLHRLWRAR